MFRIDPPTFAYLVGALSPRIDRNMGVATSTFFDIAEDVCDAIIETFPIKFDTSRDALKERA
jgi:hypothetical protein